MSVQAAMRSSTSSGSTSAAATLSHSTLRRQGSHSDEQLGSPAAMLQRSSDLGQRSEASGRPFRAAAGTSAAHQAVSWQRDTVMSREALQPDSIAFQVLLKKPTRGKNQASPEDRTLSLFATNVDERLASSTSAAFHPASGSQERDSSYGSGVSLQEDLGGSAEGRDRSANVREETEIDNRGGRASPSGAASFQATLREFNALRRRSGAPHPAWIIASPLIQVLHTP